MDELSYGERMKMGIKALAGDKSAGDNTNVTPEEGGSSGGSA